MRTDMNNDDFQRLFRYDQLRVFFEHIKGRFDVFPLKEWEGQPGILLRHDIDLDLDAAVRMALLEKEYGLRSTFFILTGCSTYNPASNGGRKALDTILECGCEIGLHFDPTPYSGVTFEELSQKVDDEAEWLGTLTGSPVRSISLHNPFQSNSFPIFEKYRNTYDPVIFSDEVYLSDSRMDFSGKNPFNFVTLANEKTLQILLHPLHFTINGDSYPDIFAAFAGKFVSRIDEYFSTVNSGYLSQKNGDLISYCCSKWK